MIVIEISCLECALLCYKHEILMEVISSQVHYNPVHMVCKTVCTASSLQCFDADGGATGKVSIMQQAGWWFIGGDDLTGALHVL